MLRLRSALGQQKPGGDVRDDEGAEPEDGAHHDQEPDQVRVDADVLGQAAADAAEAPDPATDDAGERHAAEEASPPPRLTPTRGFARNRMWIATGEPTANNTRRELLCD